MKTGNIILVGVVGLGAVGAYLYMKNKKAQESMLTGSLPTTTSSIATPSAGTPNSSTTSAGTSTGTTSQNNEVFLPSTNDMKLVDATVLLGKIKALQVKMQQPFTGRKFIDNINQNENRPSDWTTEYRMYRATQSAYPSQLAKLLQDLDDLDYALDANNNLVKLDPNRNKEWIKIQNLYLSLVNLTDIGLLRNNAKVIELAKLGYKVDPVTKKLIKI